MSRYDWPAEPPRGERQGDDVHDDSAGRAAYNAERLGGGLDLQAALQRSRSAPPERALRPGADARAPANGLAHLWQPLGPQALLRGQADDQPRVSGRINALAVHVDGERLYAASANGGIWYSGDGGGHWLSLAGTAATQSAGIRRPAHRNASAAVHVVWGATADSDLVFAGTGETKQLNQGKAGHAELGIGILVASGPVKAVRDDPRADPWSVEAPALINEAVFRFARHPADANLIVAATTRGLFARSGSGAGSSGREWSLVPDGPWTASKPRRCTDVLWTPAAGTSLATLWVWVEHGDDGGLWLRKQGASDFKKVAVQGGSPYSYPDGRGTLAAPTVPTRIWVFCHRGGGVNQGLFRIDNPAADVAALARGVQGVPANLGAGDYCLALAAHPTQADRVVLAGTLVAQPTPENREDEFNASIVTASVGEVAGKLVFGPAPNLPLKLGLGVHPDMHTLDFSNSGARLWAGCDGGIFRSDRPLEQAGFYPRNDGLSISETNYLAQHPQCEGFVMAGLQDNGIAERVSGSVWRVTEMSDGGGLVLDPRQPDLWFGQQFQGHWRHAAACPAGTTSPITRLVTNPITGASSWVKFQAEFDSAPFYTQPDVIAHSRGATPLAQLLLGTHRLWFSEDFGQTWATLPTRSDPWPGNYAQDSLGEIVIACRWQGPDTAWLLTPTRVMRIARTPGSHLGGGLGDWAAPKALLKKGIKNKDDATSADGPVRKAVHWNELAVNMLPPAAAGQPPAVRGTQGALYLGTVGHPDDAAVDTLWWFDGTSKWHVTGLRAAVPAPVTAIVCDPLLPAEVWVGTTVGVYHGTRSEPANAAPQWQWNQRVNGLPEAPVEDLALFRDGTLRLLRAAIAARGVWELRLDQQDLQALTYLRVHSDDLRHRSPSPTLRRNGKPNRNWHGSPDVRPRVAPVAPPLPAGFPLDHSKALPESSLRRYQAALRQSGPEPRVRVTGQWTAYFSEVLRSRGHAATAPVATPPSLVQVSEAQWKAAVTAAPTVEPWGSGTPTEADLHELLPEIAEGEPNKTSVTLPRALCRVEVVVHHRDETARDGADVRVVLLKWSDPKKKAPAPFDDSTKWFTAAVPWTAAVNSVLNSASGAAPGPLTQGWAFVGALNPTPRRTLAGQTLDALNAGIVSFDLNLASERKGAVVLLVAVIRAGADAALAPLTLQNLTLNDPHVAVRSLRVAP